MPRRAQVQLQALEVAAAEVAQPVVVVAAAAVVEVVLPRVPERKVAAVGPRQAQVVVRAVAEVGQLPPSAALPLRSRQGPELVRVRVAARLLPWLAPRQAPDS